MRQPLPVQLSIPAPCSKNWEQMTPDAQGRFCAHCHKSVIDFTGWTDAMLFDFFNRQKNETVCGRLLNTQLNRAIHLPPQPHSLLYRVAVALGLTILITQAQHIQARPLPPLTGQNLLTAGYPQNDSTATTDSITIKGQVLDERNEPIIATMVSLEISGKAVAATMTDTNGHFSLAIPENQYSSSDKFQVVAMSMGYQRLVKDVKLNKPVILLAFKMEPAHKLGLITITKTIENRPPLAEKATPNTKTLTRKDIHNMGY